MKPLKLFLNNKLDCELNYCLQKLNIINVSKIKKTMLGYFLCGQTNKNLYVGIKISLKYLANLDVMEDFSKELIIHEYIKKMSANKYVIEYIDRCETKSMFLLVTEYFGKYDLFDYIDNRKKLKESEIRTIFKKILRGVDFLHSIGVCHLDLSLENIMFDGKDIKIIDFGVARFCSVDDDNNLIFDYEPEQRRIGKTCYMSPEIYNCKEFNGIACDIWSLGVMLYMLVTKNQPYKYPTMDDKWFDNIKNKMLIDNMLLCNVKPTQHLTDLLYSIFVKEDVRITIKNILNHPWITEN